MPPRRSTRASLAAAAAAESAAAAAGGNDGNDGAVDAGAGAGAGATATSTSTSAASTRTTATPGASTPATSVDLKMEDGSDADRRADGKGKQDMEKGTEADVPLEGVDRKLKSDPGYVAPSDEDTDGTTFAVFVPQKRARGRVSGSGQGSTTSKRGRKVKSLPDLVGETDSEAEGMEEPASQGKGKGKGRAPASFAISRKNAAAEQNAAEEDVLTASKGKGKAREIDDINEMLADEGNEGEFGGEAGVDDDEESIFEGELSDLSDPEDDEDFQPTAKRARAKVPRGRRGAIKQSDDEEMDDLYQGGAEGSANPVAAGPSTAAAAHGSMQEEQQYETAKQREKRLKRESRQRRAEERRRNGRNRGPKLTQYEKNKLELVQHHPELATVWEDLKATVHVIKPEKAAQPEGLTIKLLPFQLEGLYWLKKQEEGPWKGGMLADEMGMGKTIQMISLFLSKPRKAPNLVIAPTVAIVQWKNEIEKFTNGSKVLLWHGANRSQEIAKLKSCDVVLTSYNVLESSFRKQEQGFKRKGELLKEKSAVHAVQWHRIVLDEAHNIKERSTNTAKGAFELKGTFRWCLSGTPLQNRVGELYSMVRFLGGDPYAFYYCKRCDCKSLHWSFSDRRHCDSCGHTPMHHVCFWNNEILKPIQNNGAEMGEGRDAFQRLRLLLERMMLRRTKLERADDMGLPPRTVEVRRDLFNEEEEDLYQSLYTDTTRKFSTYLDQGTVLNNYSNIFTLLTRMRQLANHPDLVLRSKTGTAAKLTGDHQTEEHICRLCTDVAEEPIMSRCRHIFCRECIRQYLETSVENEIPDCPVCHAIMSIDLEGPSLDPVHQAGTSARQGILGRLDMSKWRSSTKIEALVEELTKLRRDDATIKSLVFSQFVNFLDLIAFRLQRAGFAICRLEGNMSPQARDATIKLFMENPRTTVFLVSLKAGGVALNLTEASRVFLMDPWWNPSVEVQAMDRIHRLGQHRPIIVKRMIIENSIESRIIELQNKKSAMIEAAIGKDDSAMGRLSVADLRFLFTL